VLSTALDKARPKGGSRRISGRIASEPLQDPPSQVPLEPDWIRWNDVRREAGAMLDSRPDRSAASNDRNLIRLRASSSSTTALKREHGPQLAS
jgi:hypothetical protein